MQLIAGMMAQHHKISNFKTRHILLPEDGPVGLKHVGVNDEIL